MKAILLVNPASGRENVDHIVKVAKRKFEEKGYHLDVYFSTCTNDLTEKAFLWATKYDTYLVCGGDGTINEVINGLMRSEIRPKIAIVPIGTVNDFAKILGVPKKIEKNIDFIFNNEAVATDVNQINDKYFIYVTAAGYLTSVSYEAKREEKKKYGSMAYFRAGIRSLNKKPFFRARIEYDDKVCEKDVSLMLALSANQFGGLKLFRFSKKTKLNDGLVDIRIFTDRNLALILRLVMFILLAGKKQYKELHISTDHAIITPLNGEDVKWNCDGELLAEGKIELKVIPRAIEFYAHPKQIKKFY